MTFHSLTLLLQKQDDSEDRVDLCLREVQGWPLHLTPKRTQSRHLLVPVLVRESKRDAVCTEE